MVLQPQVQQAGATGFAVGEMLTVMADETATGAAAVPELPSQEDTDAAPGLAAGRLAGQCQAMPGLAFTHFPRLEADFARRGQPFIATPGFVPGIATVDERRHRHQLRTLLIKDRKSTRLNSSH